MPISRRSKKSTQPRSYYPRYAQHLNLQSKVDEFKTHAKKAELAIRENYGEGRIPPDWCGDGWDDEFALAYKAIRDHLSHSSVSYFDAPPRTAYCSFPFKAENPVEALMFLLNPADEAFGEPGYLESPEYQKIKAAANKVLLYLLDPPLELFLTDIEVQIVRAITVLPQNAKEIASEINCEEQTVRKYAPGLCERGLIMKAPKNGYYKVT